jgi:outer membrane protein TolC
VKVHAAYRLIELYRTSVLPQAEQALIVSEAGYQANTVTFMELLDTARAMFDFRLEYYQYLYQYAAATAQLEQLVGVNLD